MNFVSDDKKSNNLTILRFVDRLTYICVFALLYMTATCTSFFKPNGHAHTVSIYVHGGCQCHCNSTQIQGIDQQLHYQK